MGANFKELEKFTKEVEKLNKEQREEFLEACCKELAARLLAKVIKRTPTGKKPEANGDESIKIKVAESTTVQRKAGNGYVTYQRKVMRTRSFLTAEGARMQQHWGGYVGGTLKRGWTGGKEVKKTLADAMEYANGLSIQKIGNTYHIDITNPVEYASYVEYGHRQTPGRYVPALGKELKKGWAPGHFMLTISETELNSMKERILQAKLKKFMKDVFG